MAPKKNGGRAVDPSHIKRTKEIKLQPCKLTSEEKQDLSLELVAKMQRVERVFDGLKRTTKKVKNNMKPYEARILEVRDLLAAGEELRDVDCECVFDYEANRVTITRLDTGEVVADRELSTAEKQMDLGIDNDSDDEGATGDENNDTSDGAVPCEDCNGSGVNEDQSDCEACGGSAIASGDGDDE